MYDVRVRADQISSLFHRMGCVLVTLPFFHLGVPVGQNMARVKAWSFIMDRFLGRLAGWKARCLSFGVYLTLIKSVPGSLGIYMISLFLVPLMVEGLGVGSLFAFNRAMLLC